MTFDPGNPITSGDLIEDRDGAPLPHELQPQGAIFEAVYQSLTCAVTVVEGYQETSDIMRALAPILWPLLPSNDHRDDRNILRCDYDCTICHEGEDGE